VYSVYSVYSVFSFCGVLHCLDAGSPASATGYMSSRGLTSHSHSNAGQCTRCSSMKS
jgi:hypothetical protein